MAARKRWKVGDRVQVKPSPRHQMWWIYAGLQGTVEQELPGAFAEGEPGYRIALDQRGTLSAVIPGHCLEREPKAKRALTSG